MHTLSSATVPTLVLDRAKIEVVAIYKAIGVDIVWTDDPHVVPTALIVKIVPEDTAGRFKVPKSALGVALRTDKRLAGRFAYVFYDRIDRAAATRRLNTERLLAAAIAHELGHLLLPHGDHSSTGLMRAAWDEMHFRNVASGLLQFTREQGEGIRRRLSTWPS